MLVATKTCLSRQIFVMSKALSRQEYFVASKLCLSQQNFCRDTHTFSRKKHVFCRDKSMRVATKTRVCCDKKKRKKRRYLWQLPPMIEGNSFKSHAILTFRARAAIAVQPVTVVTLTVVGSVHVDTTLLTIVCVRRTFVYVCEEE